MKRPVARCLLGVVLAFLVAEPVHAIVDVATTDNDTGVDYNSDGYVDAADYTVWRDHLGDTGTAGEVIGDGTGDDLLGMSDGDVDHYDYEYWKQHYGEVVPTWWNGDPGWYSVSSSGGNFIYLGDSWVLAIGNYDGLPVHFGTDSFAPIPKQVFIVPNPTDWPGGLSAESNLRLIRIAGDPGVPAVTLAAQPPPLGGEVVFIGQGRGRAADMTNWLVDTSDPDDWSWTELTGGGGNFHGYKASGTTVKRWGTNTIADEDPLFGENDADLNHVVTRNGRHVVSLVTTFDQLDPDDPRHEAQTIAGDTGSAVFYNRDGQWELTGVVNSFLTDLANPDQSTTWAVFGNKTAFADVSVYRDAIAGTNGVMESHREYSVMGDINLDGSVTGDGTGAPATDDVAAFVAGWGYTGSAGIESWKNGDISGPLGQPDGKTDVFDFLKVRSVLPSASGSLVSLPGMGTTTAPESSSAALVCLGGVLAAGGLRRRRWIR